MSLSDLASVVEEASSVLIATTKRTYLEPLNCNLLKIGIIGAPNVGKSTLFNCLVRNEDKDSIVENTVFTTIDPYIGTFTPKDDRMDYFLKIFPEATSVIPTQCTVVDTAAIIQGSFKDKCGVGMSSIDLLYDVDIIIHVIRCFDNVHHASYIESFDPLRDLKDVEQEIMLKDLYKLEKQLMEVEHIMRIDDTCIRSEHMQILYITLKKLWEFVSGEKRPKPPHESKFKMSKSLYRTKMPKVCQGKPIRLGKWNVPEREIIRELQLLTAKEVVYAVNVNSMDYHRKREQPCFGEIREYLQEREDPCADLFLWSGEFEQKLLDLEREGGIAAVDDYFYCNNTQVPAMPRLFLQMCITLNCIQYYTLFSENDGRGGENREIRCWLIRQGSTALEAANKKDVRIARNFMRAEIISFEEYHMFKGDRLKLNMDGKIHMEGRKYIVNDGDILDFFHHPF